ncbi:signal peptidase I [Pelagibacteraceae bacterium]|nr:signal peptidase I [Pelagibacteraceae bacterium]
MSDKKINASWIKSNLLTLFYALVIALIIRTFLIQPFFIPSSSMEPNLLVGDRLFASKFDYGYSKHSFPFSLGPISNRIFSNVPDRGDVIIFKPPHTNLDYIKRLIGLPGDRIEVQNGNLIINSKSLEYENIREDSKVLKNGRVIKINVLKETLPNGISYEIYNYLDGSPGDNTKEFVVPENHYFFMGDNRDNSNDSRFWGTVEFNRLVGKAQIIFFSTEGGSTILEFWKWPFDIQFNRLLKLIN